MQDMIDRGILDIFRSRDIPAIFYNKNEGVGSRVHLDKSHGFFISQIAANTAIP